MLFRREQVVRERAVVGQKQQPLRVLVEPPDGKQADLSILGRKQVEYRLPASVFGRREHARGLVEHHIRVLAVEKLFAVHADARGQGIALVLRTGRDAPVDEHATLAHEGLDLAARIAPGRGDDLVESLLCHGGSRLSAF